MRICLRRVLSGVLIAFLFLCDNTTATASPITKTLSNDTRIIPPGFTVSTWSEIPKFKKGTIVTLTMYGEVLEGTLAEDVNLPYESGKTRDSVKPTAMAYIPPHTLYVPISYILTPINRVLRFKGGTKVIFNDRGEAISGTLISGSGQNIVINTSNYITVSGGEISFHKNGMLALCTLSLDSYLRPIGWKHILTDNITDNVSCPGFVEFKADNPVWLTEKGEVIKGTLNKNTKLRTSVPLLIGLSEIETKLFEAGTEVEFDAEGVASKVSK